MIRLDNMIVLITGASSGIGQACARAFAGQGARCILAARRLDRLEALAAELRETHDAECLCVELDVRNRDSVEAMVAGLPANWLDVGILVNNAGLSRGMDKIHEGSTGDWEEMIDTNVKGLLWVSRAVLPGMVARGRGHVVNLGSIAGVDTYPGGNVYCATKHAVRSLSTAMRMDLLGKNIRVSNIQPGMVETEFSVVRFHGDEDRAAKVYENIEALMAADIADAVLYVCTRPAHVDVSELTIMPVNQAGPTLVHRQPREA